MYLILSENLIKQAGAILNHRTNGNAIANGTDDLFAQAVGRRTSPDHSFVYISVAQ